VQIKKFLLDKVNSTSKEVIFNYKVFYDLKLAAAEHGYDLSIYIPDVDRDGYDVIFDDRDSIKKVQLKTFLTTTSSWDIHKSIVRPHFHASEDLGLEPSPTGSGCQGGVILIEIKLKEDEVTTSYWYTDIFILKALQLGIVTRKPKIKGSILNNFYEELRNGVSYEKIKIKMKKSMFVKAKTSGHLLTLMGLHGPGSLTWYDKIIQLSKCKLRIIAESKLPSPLEILKKQAKENLIELTLNLK